jgi:hypothetical protein
VPPCSPRGELSDTRGGDDRCTHRGRYQAPGTPQTDEKPLHLYLTAATAVEGLEAKQKAVDDAAAYLESLIRGEGLPPPQQQQHSMHAHPPPGHQHSPNVHAPPPGGCSLGAGCLYECVAYGVQESVHMRGLVEATVQSMSHFSDSTFTRHAGHAAGYGYHHYYGAPLLPAPAPHAAQYAGATNSSNGEGGGGGTGGGGGGGAVRLSIPVCLAPTAVEPSAGMGVHARLTGTADANFAHVLTQTGVRCTLRGLGTADAPHEPLQVVLDAPTLNALQAARALVENLVGTVVTDVMRVNPSAAAVAAAPMGYPQLQSMPTGGYGMLQQPPPHATGRWGASLQPHHMGGMGVGMGMHAPPPSAYAQPSYNNGVS